MYRHAKWIVAIGLIAGFATAARSEMPAAEGVAAGGNTLATSSNSQMSGKWELGPTGNFGFGAGDRSDFHFASVGFQVGRVLTPVIPAGPFSGRFEAGVDVVPFWQAYTPASHTQTVDTPNGPIVQRIGGGTYTGASVSPVVWRWDFAPHSQKYMPWAQASAGVLYTTHKFPPTLEVPEGTPGGTSVFNFRSGGGFGVHYFTKPKRSVDFLVLAEHISSASLGDKNPGVNASVQLFVGYTWWK